MGRPMRNRSGMNTSIGKDPIKRSNVITDMVQSIVQIPDAIQRSVFIKDCARIMSVDENVLISEVARKRVQQAGGGREASDFMQRQRGLIEREQREQRVEIDITKPTDVGSSIETLEYELAHSCRASHGPQVPNQQQIKLPPNPRQTP